MAAQDQHDLLKQRWKCRLSKVRPFDEADPFNPGHHVRGWICKEVHSDNEGSLCIAAVDGAVLSIPHHVRGVPKLRYPYRDRTRVLSYDLGPPCAWAVFSPKWNGVNMVLFWYRDLEGEPVFSWRTKGRPFAEDGPYGRFRTLIMDYFRDEGRASRLAALIADWCLQLRSPSSEASGPPPLESVSFEAVGVAEPHLVRYVFNFAIVPLFVTDIHGDIWPATPEIVGRLGLDLHGGGDVPPAEFVVLERPSARLLEQTARRLQAADEAENEAFRRKHGLPVRYECGHFATEGRVLYPLDVRGRVIGRTLFKIKPESVERVHWATFDDDARDRVREALFKAIARWFGPVGSGRSWDGGDDDVWWVFCWDDDMVDAQGGCGMRPPVPEAPSSQGRPPPMGPNAGLIEVLRGRRPCFIRGLRMADQSITDELDFGPKTWAKFKMQVAECLRTLRANAPWSIVPPARDQRAVVMVLSADADERGGRSVQWLQGRGWEIVKADSAGASNPRTPSSDCFVGPAPPVFVGRFVVVGKKLRNPTFRRALVKDIRGQVGVRNVIAIAFIQSGLGAPSEAEGFTRVIAVKPHGLAEQGDALRVQALRELVVALGEDDPV